jgi:diadenosine tetraphosphatase ApaH/serine/threonine PP2A family protein phosphatase
VVTDDYLWFKPEQLPHASFNAPRNRKTLVNVGSVGQPRDQNPQACYVLFNREPREITFRRVNYDVPAAQERFKKYSQLHPRTWQRLQNGV